MTAMIHQLKTWPTEFHAIASGLKTFEYRPYDRPFRVGDVLELHEWIPDSASFTGNVLQVEVTYMLSALFGVPEGFVCMAVRPINREGSQ